MPPPPCIPIKKECRVAQVPILGPGNPRLPKPAPPAPSPSGSANLTCPRLASSILGGVIMKTHDTCPRNCSLGNYIALPDHALNGGIAERIAHGRPVGRYDPAPRPPCVTGVTAQALAAIVGSGTELERISYARNCCGKRCDRSESIGRL